MRTLLRRIRGTVGIGLFWSLPWAIAGAPPLDAQEPTGVLTGTVVDAATGAPVTGALLTVGDQGPRGIADREGRFTLGNVPTGSQRLRVQRFGYRDLELTVDVGTSPTSLALRLDVDPVALEGLTVTGGAKVALGGTVLDARTGEPVPWAEVSLTRDVVRDLGRAAADRQGIFSIEDVSTGRYLLRVERIGYQGQLLPLDVSAPPEVVEIHLEPDSALLAGLAELERQLGFRRRAATSVAQSFGEDRLRLSTMSGMRRFLENDAMLSLMPCDGREVRNDCRVLRGRVVPPRVYIDELLAQGLDHLDSYQPYELYSVDVFVCGPGDRLGGWEIHVYTYEYVDRQMKRRRQFFPSCFAL